MNLAGVFFALAFFSAFIYMALGLLAYSHRSKEDGVDKGWVLSPIWALFPLAYDEKGKHLCVIGKPFFWIATLLACCWLALDYLAK